METNIGEKPENLSLKHVHYIFYANLYKIKKNYIKLSIQIGQRLDNMFLHV